MRKISIVIATHARTQLLERTLDSIASAHPRKALRSVWILENGADCGARELCDRFTGRLPMQYRFSEQAGKSRAHQSVLPEMGHDLLLFLDDDVRVHEALLERYAEAASKYGPRHFFGGSVRIDYEVSPLSWLLPHLPASARGFEPSGSTAEFLGANFAAFADDIRAAGGFDPSFGPGAMNEASDSSPSGDETVLQRRLIQTGCNPVPLPDAILWHWVPRERCTPEWALRRAERDAMAGALLGPEFERTVFGVPPWALRELVKGLLALLSSLVTRNDQKRFARRLAFHTSLGLSRGYRLGRK